MKYLATAASLIAMTASGALAGGIDRSGQSVGIIFEKGNYTELSFGSVNPEVSGTAVAGLGGFDSGDMAESYTQLAVGSKMQINENLAFALIADQPYGANVEYPTGTGYYAEGSTAEVTSGALTGVIKFTTDNNISVYGGLRYQSLNAAASIPFVGGYTITADRSYGNGYLLGAAYERPEIALRVALTYNSAIDHEIDVVEFGALPSTVDVTMPQSINLDVQSGIAADTLLFGSARWVEWSALDFAPPAYAGVTGGSSLLSYDNDTITYSLGVGRRLNDNLSVAISGTYEAAQGGFSSNLGPTDGSTSLGVGVNLTEGNVKATVGARYIWIGDAETEIPGFSPSATFTDNSGMAFGFKIGINL